MSNDHIANPAHSVGLKKFWLGHLLALASAVIFALLTIRLCFFVDTYAVNLLFWDQWDFYAPLFDSSDAWGLFAHQHGPHRQGLGMLITAALAFASDWNTRWDSFAVLCCVVAATLLATRLGVNGGFNWCVSLVAAALLFLNLRQYEIFVGTPNLSHGALPVTLLMATCLAFYLRDAWTRAVLLAALTFALVFTGFGLFAGLIILPVVIAEGVARLTHQEKVDILPLVFLLAATGLTWAAFSVGYVFAPAVANFQFPHGRPWEYVQFTALLAAHTIGIPGAGWWPFACGVVIWSLVLLVTIGHGIRLLTCAGVPAVNMTIVTLAGFSMLFAVSTAIGRVCLGVEGAHTSRYIILILPALFALFLGFRTLPQACSIASVVLFLAAITPGALMLNEKDREHITESRRGRLAWREAYLLSRDEDAANSWASYSVYPVPGMIRERLQFLEHRGLSFFSSVGNAPTAPSCTQLPADVVR